MATGSGTKANEEESKEEDKEGFIQLDSSIRVSMRKIFIGWLHSSRFPALNFNEGDR